MRSELSIQCGCEFGIVGRPDLTWEASISVAFVHACKNEEDGQCTYNVTWKCIRATMVAVEKQ
jgi:hypothetical protein